MIGKRPSSRPARGQVMILEHRKGDTISMEIKKKDKGQLSHKISKGKDIMV